MMMPEYICQVGKSVRSCSISTINTQHVHLILSFSHTFPFARFIFYFLNQYV